MKFHHILGALLIGMGAIVLSAAMFASNSQGSAESHRIDIGLVAEPNFFEIPSNSSPESHRIVVRLKNVSRDIIKIISVNSSCGCTVANDIPAEPIQPGREVQFPVVVSPQQFGTKDITVTITTNSKLTPLVQVRITARGDSIQPPFITVAPAQIRLVGHKPNERIVQEFAIESVESDPDVPWIQGVKSSDPSLSCMPVEPPLSEPPVGGLIRRTYRFQIRGDLSGRQMTTLPLEIVTSSPATRPVMPIWVNLSFESMIRAVPSVLSVRRKPAETAIQRELLIIAETNSNWSCEPIDSKLPRGITVSGVFSETETKVRRFRVGIDEHGFDALRNSEDRRVVLRFQTDVEAYPAVEIPLILKD